MTVSRRIVSGISMEKTASLVIVLALACWTSAELVDDAPSNHLLEGDLAQNADYFLKTAENELSDEARDPFKKSLLPLLIGITLKAGSLIPAKLMFLTFVVVMALVFAKMGLLVSALVGYLHYHEAHKASLAVATDKWIIPTTTHAPAHHPPPESLPTEPHPVILSAGTNTKRQQLNQYDPYRYDTFPNDPYRFSRYDYPL